jgi:hypothetical protein
MIITFTKVMKSPYRKRDLPQVQGEKSPHAKYTQDIVIKAIEMIINGYTRSEVSQSLKINKDYLSHVMAGRSWRNIAHTKERLLLWSEYMQSDIKGGILQPEVLRKKRYEMWKKNIGWQLQRFSKKELI